MSYADLKDALRETLERKGTLDRVKAQIRAEVFHSMDAEGDAHPLLTHEHLLLNEAIREYLQFAGYEHTLSVFMAEASQPSEPLSRDLLSRKLELPKLRATTGDNAGADMPLLYALLAPAPTPTGAAADTEPRAQARRAPPAQPAAAHGRAAPAPTLVQFTASGVPAACAGEEAF